MSTIEKMAFDNIAKSIPNLRKNGLKKTINEAIAWANETAEIEELVVKDPHEYWTPPFVPDGSRLRKMRYAKCGGRCPIVEMWEIEDTSKITSEKMDKITNWWFNNFEGELPFFELWVTDRWGNNKNKVWADYEYGYEMTESMFVPFYEEAIEAVLI